MKKCPGKLPKEKKNFCFFSFLNSILQFCFSLHLFFLESVKKERKRYEGENKRKTKSSKSSTKAQQNTEQNFFFSYCCWLIQRERCFQREERERKKEKLFKFTRNFHFCVKIVCSRRIICGYYWWLLMSTHPSHIFWILNKQCKIVRNNTIKKKKDKTGFFLLFFFLKGTKQKKGLNLSLSFFCRKQ